LQQVDGLAIAAHVGRELFVGPRYHAGQVGLDNPDPLQPYPLPLVIGVPRYHEELRHQANLAALQYEVDDASAFGGGRSSRLDVSSTVWRQTQKLRVVTHAEHLRTSGESSTPE
jgi:hypothetical protein